MEEAEEFNNPAAHQNLFQFMERIIGKPKEIGKSSILIRLREHYQKCFSGIDQPLTPTDKIINFATNEKVATAKCLLKKRRIPGPEEVTSEKHR